DATRLRFPPGSAFAYSNIGYMLLRRVLVRASGEDFASLLQRVVFTPAGVNDASVPTTSEELSAFIFAPSRYLSRGSGPVDVASAYDPGWIAHGVVGTSVVSAGRLLHALFGGALLPTELVHEIVKGRAVELPDANSLWQRPAYGLGLMMTWDEDGGPALGHRGGGPGCSPALFHFPGKEKPLTVCVITTGEDPDQPVALVRAAAATFSEGTARSWFHTS